MYRKVNVGTYFTKPSKQLKKLITYDDQFEIFFYEPISIGNDA